MQFGCRACGAYAAQLHLPTGCADLAVQLDGGGQRENHRCRDGASRQAQQLARRSIASKRAPTASERREEGALQPQCELRACLRLKQVSSSMISVEMAHLAVHISSMPAPGRMLVPCTT